MTLEFTPSWYPKLVFSTNFLFQAQNTPLHNCVPSLGFFSSPLTVYPDFDSCYSHFMPYPSVRHRAIEVHYYYYYTVEKQFLNTWLIEKRWTPYIRCWYRWSTTCLNFWVWLRLLGLFLLLLLQPVSHRLYTFNGNNLIIRALIIISEL